MSAREKSLQQQSLHDMVREAGRLYSLPDICLQLQELLARQASVFEIADQVALDPALTARLLKLANSPFYHFAMPIESVSRAVRLIGTNELYNLALATSAAASFHRIPRTLLDMEAFWERAVYTGLIAKYLGQQIGFRQGERLFTAGLLHNIGLLCLIEQRPDDCRAILEQSAGHYRPEIEQARLGFSFAEAGHALLSAWRLPTGITLCVLYQHQPALAGAERVAALLVHVARFGAAHLLAGFPPEQPPEQTSEWLAELQAGWQESVGLPMDALPAALRLARVSALQVLSIIAPGASVVA